MRSIHTSAADDSERDSAVPAEALIAVIDDDESLRIGLVTAMGCAMLITLSPWGIGRP